MYVQFVDGILCSWIENFIFLRKIFSFKFTVLHSVHCHDLKNIVYTNVAKIKKYTLQAM